MISYKNIENRFTVLVPVYKFQNEKYLKSSVQLALIITEAPFT